MSREAARGSVPDHEGDLTARGEHDLARRSPECFCGDQAPLQLGLRSTSERITRVRAELGRARSTQRRRRGTAVRADLLAKLERREVARSEFEHAAALMRDGSERTLLLARATERAMRGTRARAAGARGGARSGLQRRRRRRRTRAGLHCDRRVAERLPVSVHAASHAKRVLGSRREEPPRASRHALDLDAQLVDQPESPVAVAWKRHALASERHPCSNPDAIRTRD